MPHRRPRHLGSFGSHFDELVPQFPDKASPDPDKGQQAERDARLKEKIDIHRLLFEQAWQLDGSGGDR